MSSTSRRRASPPSHQAVWKEMYEHTPAEDLPWFSPGPSPPVERAVTAKFLAAGGAVLDIGCGAGSNVLHLARSGFQAYGVDLSPGAIRAAAARAKEVGAVVDLRVGDALGLDFPDARFDGVIDNGCFHTLPIGRRADYAREVFRILRPDGSFVLSWVAREHTAPMGPHHRPSLEEVTKILEKGFLFVRTGFHPSLEEGAPSVYDAWLMRRSVPQPPLR